MKSRIEIWRKLAQRQTNNKSCAEDFPEICRIFAEVWQEI